MSKQKFLSAFRDGCEPFLHMGKAFVGETRCEQCSKTTEEADTKLKACAGCFHVMYCSVDCQREHWKAHKIECQRVASGQHLKDLMFRPAGDLSKTHLLGDKRTVGQVLEDMTAWVKVHNHETGTLMAAAWQALGLSGDIQARKSKAFLVALNRTSSTNPETYYTLKEACVAPIAELKVILAGRFTAQNPIKFFKEQEKEQRERGSIGSMLVICVELAEDDHRPVREAIKHVSTMTFQTMAVLERAGDNLRKIIGGTGQLPERMWKAFLHDALHGAIPKMPLEK